MDSIFQLPLLSWSIEFRLGHQVIKSFYSVRESVQENSLSARQVYLTLGL